MSQLALIHLIFILSGGCITLAIILHRCIFNNNDIIEDSDANEITNTRTEVILFEIVLELTNQNNLTML